jgi:hypothetical protein
MNNGLHARIIRKNNAIKLDHYTNVRLIIISYAYITLYIYIYMSLITSYYLLINDRSVLPIICSNGK